MFSLQMITELFYMKTFGLFMWLVIYSAALILTCGKEGAFFSIVTMLALKGIDHKKRIYKICGFVAVLGTLISMYLERNGVNTIRYINGEWTYIYKRSNILYISFMTIIGIYIMQKQKANIKEIFCIALLGYGMYKYTGSRTGMVVSVVLSFLLLLFHSQTIARQKIIRWFCIATPAICLFSSIVMNFFYGKIAVLNVLNASMQGRLEQGKFYFDHYDIKLLGQKIFESLDSLNFQNLDCAYLDMLLCYGLLFTILWVVISSLVINWLYASKRYAEVALIMMYAVYGLSETFLPNCFLNPSLFLYGEYLYEKFSQHQRFKQSIKNDYEATLMKG